jgi:glycosyltransferase involved in cell wall biosynthesis
MKILISTPVFKPMIGGMEVLADNFAVHFTNLGHSVVLVTPVAAEEPDEAIYSIVRQPSKVDFFRLVQNADIIFSNGANLYSAVYSILAQKPVIMRHTGYQISAIDGLGWHKGKPAPLRPTASVIHHVKNSNLISTIKGTLKLVFLRLYAKKFVSVNVAISDWMKYRHPLPNQIRIHNPFPITRFVSAINNTGDYDYDFFFLGRLVSEKGIDVLLEAFSTLQNRSNNRYSLCIIGKGPEREKLENVVLRTGQCKKVHFTGMLTGESLIDMVRICHIAVLPSIWEEPFGGVASELLAARKNIIVSRDGALSEIIGDAGLAFPNGDAQALADAMFELVNDEVKQAEHLQSGAMRIRDFNEKKIINKYIGLFEKVLRKENFI